MSEVRTYNCEVCGAEKGSTNHWFLVKENPEEQTLTISRWKNELASDRRVHHACGEQDVERLVSRWLASGRIATVPSEFYVRQIWSSDRKGMLSTEP
ncbi:MAG: hypothetical protein ABSA54_00755 [Terriglobales bacterium]